MKWKDFLYYQRGEQLAIIVLLVLIVFILVLNIVLRQRSSTVITQIQNDSLIYKFESFRQKYKSESINEKENHRQYSNNKNRPYYGNREKSDYSYEDRKHFESETKTPFPRQEKLAAGETIFLNSTDTAEWKKIPGIGSSYAERIVKYRNLLGGFASTKQLLEVYGIDNEMFSRISPYIEPDNNLRKIQINKSEFKELLSHPYLNYKQVQAITNLRKRKGKITSLNELTMLEEFTTEDIERLKPYLEF